VRGGDVKRRSARQTVLLSGVVMAALAAVGIGLAAPTPATAQPATILKDIATSGVNSLAIAPTDFIAFDGVLYFFADDGIDGRELWRTDGTETGTWRVRDICPGQCSATFSTELVVFQGALYFQANDGVHGRELWRTDGTAAGTELAVDVVPGLESSSPWWLTLFDDKLVFVARSADGWEPWVTDGTPGGTVELADINPDGDSWPSSFVVWKGAAWFIAYDPAHGEELWTTDGTPGGTHLVRDIQPGPSGSLNFDQTPWTHFYTPTPVGDVLVFPADDGIHGWELWATDGTAAGTALLADLEPGSGDSNPTELTPFDGALFFRAEPSATGRELFRTDGTPAGTTLFEDLVPGSDSSNPFALTAVGSHLFFSADNGSDGQELWVSDGTPAGTTEVEDIDPGSGGALVWTFPFSMHAFGNGLLFAADDGTHGLEPWVSDGTPGGTHLLGDVNPGSASAFDFLFALFFPGDFGGEAHFFAFDPDHGWEPRTSAGGAGDATLLRDIDQQASSIISGLSGFRYTEMKDVAGTLFFLARDPDHGLELWATDGSGATTRLVRDVYPGPYSGVSGRFAGLGSLLLFEGSTDYSSGHLWTSDGSEANTAPLAGASPEPLDPHDLTPFGDQVYFGAREDGVGDHLWRTDGTGAGTHPFPEGSPVPGPWEMAVAGGRLFVATDDELWVSGGDAGSTEKLADVTARDLAAAGPLLVFSGDDGASGPELWVSDGTPGGTHRVLELQAGAAGGVTPHQVSLSLPLPSYPNIAGVASPAAAFFVGDDGVHGRELWWSDGTAANTRMLGDLRSGPLGSNPRYLTIVRGVAYFVADDGVHGAELWRSDGTAAGTSLLADLEPGADSSIPDSLINVYGTLFFSAWRSTDGRELWQSDGTAAGTVRLQDINPGPDSSSPAYFTTSGNRLFFIANDGTRGFEPWSLPAVPPRLVATKQVSGDLRAGGTATYLIALQNPGDFDLVDNPGDEVVDPLPEGLTVLAATADAGLTTVDPDQRTVRWNGPVPAGGTVTVTIQAAIALDAQGKLLTNQAELAYDADGTGDNETRSLSDDPGADGGTDPTEFVVGAPSVVEIPTVRPVGLVLLAFLLGGAGFLRSRL